MGTERSLEYSDSDISDCEIQLPGVSAVPVVNQGSIALFVANGLPKSRQGPSCAGIGSDIEVDKSSRGCFHGHKHIDDLKARRYGNREIASQHGLRVIAQEGVLGCKGGSGLKEVIREPNAIKNEVIRVQEASEKPSRSMLGESYRTA